MHILRLISRLRRRIIKNVIDVLVINGQTWNCLPICIFLMMLFDKMLAILYNFIYEKEALQMVKRYCTYYIKQIYDYVEKRANNEFRKYDLTLAQMTVLMILSSHPQGVLALKSLEHELGVAQSTTLGIVDRLEQKGFVRKMDSPDDKRVKLVQIMPEGMVPCNSTQSDMDVGEEYLLRGLNAEERTTLKRLLQKVCKNIE